MNKQDFEKLKSDLHKHHILCEGNACTSHPIFMVQKLNIIWGVHPEYGYDVTEIWDHKDCQSYKGIVDFLDHQDEDFDIEHLQDLCDFVSEDYESGMTCKSIVEDEIDNVGRYSEDNFVEFFQENGVEITQGYGRHRWEDVTMFFTREKAEEFCNEFKYRHGKLRVYVKSGWESEEYKNLIKAILDGNLVWKE